MKTAKEILLKHVLEGKSEKLRKFYELVDYSVYLEAMYEYGEQQRQHGIEQGKNIEKYGTDNYIE